MTTAPDWQTRVGDVWAAEWQRTDRSFADFAPHLDAAILAVAPDHGRAADLGCGAGATSLAIAAARPGLAIHGVDLSEPLITIAGQRTADAALSNVHFTAGAVPGDLEPSYDLAFSRHGVMFFDHPVTAFRGIAAALKPGAPLVFSCFRSPAENAWASDTVAAVGGQFDSPDGYAPGPFAFADRDRIADLLATTGFTDITITAADYHYRAGEGADPVTDAIDFFRRIGPVARKLADTPDADRPALLDRLRVMLADRVRGGVLDFPAAAWIVTAHSQGSGQ
ncbi:class I SAM-dependent methyltransferase [Sphingomonas jeddahensis]|uniref:N5-glutamine S-adenosyl-L-methionine-dependent methyltransferase n=1 Tax=Sphingomonas jeddahensis TaxID=1915074 RepID=A0A1V2EYM5_9SPHN|nr:class I SAM-dependent methyltransferase [Sphingomonas jeddahensis]ONF97279.1 N5-glutamine S-adenosyl-L-methionine-dependent methyltransferase [Sphingomonas jeddahensis]